MAGEIGGRPRIIRRTIPVVPAGNISLNAAQAFKMLDRATLGIDIFVPSGGNTIRVYDKFPWEPRQKVLDEALQNDPVGNLVLVANLGTDYFTVAGGERWHMEHIEFRELWVMAETGAQAGVEIVAAARQS